MVAGMMGGAGPGQHVVLEIRSGGSQFDELLLHVLRKAVPVRGGNVQLVMVQR
jgi:trimeric autotransporter adhesin